jgi:hypothetical protein
VGCFHPGKDLVGGQVALPLHAPDDEGCPRAGRSRQVASPLAHRVD